MKLSANKVAHLSKSGTVGRHLDGDGLSLWVRGGERQAMWLLRFRTGGRQRNMSLGTYPSVSLAEARRLAALARDKIRTGADPLAAREAERDARAKAAASARARTFEAVAEDYIARHEPSWKNAKHRWQWRATLATHAYPRIGAKDVAEIKRGDILAILEPIWTKIPETADRLRGRLETVLDVAIDREWRAPDNPATRKALRHALPERKRQGVAHHAALPYGRAAEFMDTLRTHSATAARALEFVILTAARTSEVLHARWREIDLDAAVWTLPAARMKSGLVHRVPLSNAALAVLRTMAGGEGMPLLDEPGAMDALVFPGQRDGAPLSNMAMLVLLRRMQAKGGSRWVDGEHRPITPHGFRSTFRDWAADRTEFPREVVERALAHAVGSEVELAYQRSDLLARRQPLMEAWASYLATTEDEAAVVPFRRRAG